MLPSTTNNRDIDLAAHPNHRLPCVFLSACSGEWGLDRANLKRECSEHGIDLRVQEDFQDIGSPYGTLLKIVAVMKDCDLVVQLIGPTKSRNVPAAVCRELLTELPDFGAWLKQRGLRSAFRAGAISYVAFEGYAALFLRKAFSLARYRSGADPHYEQHLRRLGRHVEHHLQSVDALIPFISAQLKLVKRLDAQGAQQRHQQASESASKVGLFVLLACCVVSFLIQFNFATMTANPFSLRMWLTQLVSAIGLLAVPMLLQLAIITDQLTLGFKLKVAARNGIVFGLIFSLGAWLSFLHPQSIAIAGDSPSNWYWGWTLFGQILLLAATWSDNRDLELEIEHGTSDLTPGTTERSSHFFWVARQTIMEARRSEDFGQTR